MIKDIKVEAIHPDEQKWKQMISIYNACIMADVKVPDEVLSYLSSGKIYTETTDIEKAIFTINDHGQTYSYTMIDVTRLPAGTKYIKIKIFQ